jgi:L-threonylcarbamoyladenylate synthase
MAILGNDLAAVGRAAQLIAAGELVAFPTETVYGLGARADDDRAVGKIFAAKGRPADHPLIVHVEGIAQARLFAGDPGGVAQRLMGVYWPGPLTLILARAPHIATAAAGGHATIGLRSPSHPLARALLAQALALGVPGIAAPSANRFGRISATHAAHVIDELGEQMPVLDGGDCALGIESSIVDCSGGEPVLLRPGVLTRAQIEEAAGVRLAEPQGDAPRAPGTLQAHYAPRTKLRLMSSAMLRSALEVLGDTPLPSRNASTLKLAVYSRTVRPKPHLRHRAMPESAAQAAHELFAALRELDDAGVDLIWVEEPPEGPEWEGVRDRLQRAAAV